MPETARIAATSDVPPVAHEEFAALGGITVTDGADRRVLANADVLIVRTQRVDAELLGRAPRLRAIARTGAGVDTIDLAAATQAGVPVLYAPGLGTVPMAEGTLALIFAASKRLRELGSIVTDGRWEERYRCQPLDLNGATLGIVGLGRVGSAVASLARGIGMTVIASEARPGPLPVAHQAIANLGIDELFAQADVISLHCDLNATTRGLVNRELLAKAGPGAVLINASRAEIVDGDDVLVDALEQGWLAGVGLDVFSPEPPSPDSRLLSDPRVICTPHSIGLTASWNTQVFRGLAADVRRVLDGEVPRHLANPEVVVGASPAS